MEKMPANQDQQLYQQIINTVLDAVINMDDQGIIIEWNKSAEEIFGWKKEEVIGKLLSEIIIPPQFREAHKRGLERYRLSGEGPVLNKRIEITALSREGKEFPIELAITPVKLGDKLIFNGFIRDITERKKSREQFQQVVESAPNAMVMVDETGKIQMVNKATETLFGYAREELLEMNVDKLVPKRFQGNHHEHRRRFHSDLKVRAMGAGRDLYGLKKDGSEVPIEIGLNPIKTDRGVFVLASIIDIHERKELEKRSKEFAQQLEKEVAERTQALLRQRAAALNIMEDERQAKKRLEKAEQDLQKQAEALSRSNKDLEQFAYVASHDLQEPIRKVVGFSQLFAKEFEGKMDKNSQEYMNYIVDGAKRMQILIQDLLQFSKVSSGKLIVEPTDLNEVAAEAMQNLESVIQENKADIRLDRLPVISVHRVQIVQLFQNLIGNAIKYRGSKDPEIRITAQKQNDLWAFSIKDNGIGIAPEFFEKIFVIFQRLHGKNSKYPGTGIGLAICKRTVERHGGRIWVESAPGEGTTFKFTLPERG